MTALLADRHVKLADTGVRAFPVAANVTIFFGSLVSIDTTGYARPARVSTTDKCVGYNWKEKVVNGPVAGAKTIEVRTDRIYYAINSAAADACASTDIGADCFIVDDQTVAKTNGTGTRVRAGKIDQVTSDGVGVRFDQ